MSQPRKDILFEMQGQWIARRKATLYRCWYDPRLGRTCRTSLGTEDLELAKTRFVEAVFVEAPKTNDTPLAAVFAKYHQERSDKRVTRTQARVASRLMLECWGETIRVNGINEITQKQFYEWSIAKGHSRGTITRNLGVLLAALKFCGLAIKKCDGQTIKDWGLVFKPARRVFIPKDAELVRFFAEPMPVALFRWSVLAILTGGRPEAIHELTPAQRNADVNLLDFNPEGREQTKKYRPTVKTPPSLAEFMDVWELEMRLEVAKRTLTTPDRADISHERYITYAGRSSLKAAIKEHAIKCGIPRLSAYSFRHKVVTILRASKDPKVSEDDIATQVGHKRPNLRTTGGYGEWDADYLADAAEALENFWLLLSGRNTPRTRHIKIVKN